MKKGFRDNPVVLVLVAILAWKVWCMAFLWGGQILFLPQRNFLGEGDKYFAEPALWAWANFDGEHYLAIGQHGYGNLEQAFFPLYPFVVRWFAGVDWTSFRKLLFSGLFVSHASLVVGLVLFYKLVKLDYEEKVARWSILALLAAPTSFFLGAVYTESLFLMLVVGSFLAARRGKWWLAGILGGLASATRVVGIAVFFALVVEWWWQRKKEGRGRGRDLVFCVPLAVSGLAFYMRWLWWRWGDALYFLHAQPYFGAERSVDKVVLLYQVFWRYAKMVVTVNPISNAYYTLQLELGAALVFLVLIVISALKQRWSYTVFMVLGYVMPSLTGTFSSLPRYVLVLFPGFILIGEALAGSKWFRIVYLPVSIVLAAVTCALFTRGFWVG